jgi:hypothetical protein
MTGLALVLAASVLLQISGCVGATGSNGSGGNPPPASVQIGAVGTSGITTTAAAVSWVTNVPADSQVEFGTTASYGQSTALDSSMVMSHSVGLSGLSASTTYHFRVKSRDASGNLASSSDQTFTTLAVPDTTAPTVSITAPTQGATVSGTVSVSANASDNVGVAGVQFRLDGANLGAEDTTAPYSASWNTTTVSNGNHTLTAVARDAAGNQTTSAAVTVTVSNAAADTTPPSVSISAPAQGATVSGSVTVSATASDNVGVAGVQFQLDGVSLSAEDTVAPYSISWDTATASNATHTLTAVARDAAGNRATSASVSVTVLNNSGTVVRVGPTDSWCSTINGAAPGTTIILLAGNYSSPCRINASGTASAPITVRSESSSASQRAVMTYGGNTSNVIDISGSFLVLQWLSFNPTQDGVDAIRIHTGHDIVIQENWFTGIGGICVVYNDNGSVQRVTVRGNVMKNLSSTAMYFGCHDGVACHATELLIEGNLVDGVFSSSPNTVGYALEIKLNSYGTVRDNTMYRTKGPCITIYGSDRGDPPSIVEGNYVEASQNDAGINISGGPAIVRNNIAIGNANGGIWAQDYNGRGLQKNVWIVNNTVLNNSGAGIIVQNWASGNGNVLAFNAIAPKSGMNALSPSSPAGTVMGNITCSPASSCFDQPNTAPYDLWPLSGGPLIGAAGSGSEPWRVTDDFMGVPRGSAADVGAFQRTGPGSGPLVGGGNPRPPRQP